MSAIPVVPGGGPGSPVFGSATRTPARPEPRASSWLGPMLAGFVILLVVSPTFGLQFNLFTTRVLGPVFACFVALRYIRRPFRAFPAEFQLYLLFVMVSATGGFVAVDVSLFWKYWSLVVQVAGLFFCVLVVIRTTHTPRHVFQAFLVIAVVVMGRAVTDPAIRPTLTLGSQERLNLVSMSKGPNAIGYLMMVSIFSVAYLLPFCRTKLARAVLLGAGGAAFLFLVFAGSRKAFLATLVFLFLWFGAQAREGLGRRRQLGVLAALIALVAVAFVTRTVMQRSHLGQRMAEVGATQRFQDDKRVLLMREGWGMFLTSPIIGVGLGQFQVLSRFQAYAHSDFFELIATTGALGVGVYFWIYPCLWWRLTRLLRTIRAPDVRHELHVFRAMLVAIFLAGLGRPNFLDIYAMLAIGAMVSYSFWVERGLRSAEHPSEAVPAGRLRKTPGIAFGDRRVVWGTRP